MDQICECGARMRFEETVDGLDGWYCPACGMDRVTDADGKRVRLSWEEVR